MLKLSRVVFGGTLLLGGAVSQSAFAEVCPAGTVEAYLDGQIYNTIVGFNNNGALTYGVAKLELVTEDEKNDLLCSLIGTPTEPTDDHVYDHDIVCDDGSQLSWDTSWDPAFDPTQAESSLPRGLERKLCKGEHWSYFREVSFPDISAPLSPSGLFGDVSDGELAVRGCVVVDEEGSFHPNMQVEGHLCLSTTE